jgi:hypothetical protein
MSNNVLSEVLQKFIDSLPDPAAARLFIERLSEEAPQIFSRLSQNQELFANLLTLSAYSPLLAETMLQHKDYITWLERENETLQRSNQKRNCLKIWQDLQQSIQPFLNHLV